MRPFFVVILLLFSAINCSFAQVQARFDTVCGYLSKGIYCFGGATGTSDNSISDSTISYLDIVNNSGIPTEELGTKWVSVTPITNGLDIKSRDYAQFMALPDNKTMLLSGGWNSDRAKLVSQTITYNAETNTWTGHPNYEEPPFGNRQIYWASSVYVPEYGVGFYGGVETNVNPNWTYNGQNMSRYNDTEYDGRFIGYTSLTFFDVTKTINPWSVFPTQNNLPTFFSQSQTSIYDSETSKIFFFGGIYINDATLSNVYYSFNSSVTFDILTGTWGTQPLTGQMPIGRVSHTTTLLESTNRDVLLYGGNNADDNNRAIVNYCYTLNLDTYQWKQQNIVGANGVSLIRTRHSAVSVNKNTVFILFGKNEADIAVMSVVPLNVTDPSNISYLQSYVDPNGAPRSENGSNGSSGLSSGAIAGVAVGSVAGALIIFGALFCVWKKKEDKKKKIEMEELAKKNEIIEPPVMEVNWEEIDRHSEMYPASPISNFKYSPRLADDLTTLSDNKSEMYSASPMLIQQGLEFQRPNAVDDDYAGSPPLMKLQKPDGGV